MPHSIRMPDVRESPRDARKTMLKSRAGECLMRKATMCLLVVLSLWGATSWRPPQPLPQWTVVAERRFAGKGVFSSLPIFTPGKDGTYRFSGACTVVGGQQNDSWTFTVRWEDLSGEIVSSSLKCIVGEFDSAQQSVFMFLPKPDVPVELNGTYSGAASSYVAAFTIEQLQ